MHAEIDEMLKLGVIKKSLHIPWSSLIVVVRREEKIHLCLDNRKINSFTIKDAYLLSQIEEILSRLPKAKFISSLSIYGKHSVKSP